MSRRAISGIFDLGVRRFVATRLVKVLYTLTFIGLIFAWGFGILPFLTSGLNDPELLAYTSSAVIGTLFVLVGVRVCLEMVVMLFHLTLTAMDILDEMKKDDGSDS